MRRIVPIILVTAISLFITTTTNAKKQNSDKEKCPPYNRSCEVEKTIKEIETEVQGLAEKYRDKSIWDRPPSDPESDEATGHKIFRYSLMAPSYILRGVTWPFALVGDYMVKKNVIRTVVDLVSNDECTLWIYPKLELGFGTGFGGGIGVRHYNLFDKLYQLSASYQIHVNLNQEVHAYLKKPDAFYLADRPFTYKISTDYIHFNEVNYFGTGAETPESNQAKYGMDEIKAGGWLGYELWNNFSLRWDTYLIVDYSDPGSGGTPVNQRFNTSELNAFEETIYYLQFGSTLVHDTRNSKILPEKGGLRKFSFFRYQGLDTTNHDYNEYRLSVSQFFRATMPRHVLALHNKWIFQQETGNTIPFYRFTRLDVNSPLRAYTYGRFADKSSVVFNIEYRFPVWDFMGGQLFYDTGRIFNDPTDFSFKHFKHDGGIGIRLRTDEFFLMRFQFAYGSDGPKFIVSTSQSF